MRITAQQQGPIAQNEFIKLAMMGTNGELEGDLAITDDEGRDLELHRRRQFGAILSIQVKSSMRLVWVGDATPTLRISLQLRRLERRARGRFWFFFAYLDPVSMAFADPCYLVPSTILYRQAPRSRFGKLIVLTFVASMRPVSRDKWAAYRVAPAQLGKRLLSIIRELERESLGSLNSQQVVTEKRFKAGRPQI